MPKDPNTDDAPDDLETAAQFGKLLIHIYTDANVARALHSNGGLQENICIEECIIQIGGDTQTFLYSASIPNC